MKNKQLKKIGLAFSILVVAVGVFFCGRYIVQAVADNVYVEGDPIDIEEDEIYLTKAEKGTPVVSNTMSADGMISLPTLPEYGRGDVFLEITPDKCQQVLSWLSADNAVISDEELTRRISLVRRGPVKDQNVINDSMLQPLMGGSYQNFYVWNPEINLYEKEDDGTYKHQDILDEVSKISSDNDLTQKQKKEEIESYIHDKCYIKIGLYSVKKKYEIETTQEFGEGAEFNEVSAVALKDTYNWDTETTVNRTPIETKKTSGYFVRVNNVSDSTVGLDFANKTASVESSNQRLFKYTETKPETGRKIQTLDNYNANDTNWVNNYLWWPIQTGDYYEIEAGEEWTLHEVHVEKKFKYTYHCLTNNNVLKWGLLNPYEDQEHTSLKQEKEWKEEYNRTFKVVTVTPDELNAQEKFDTKDTLDYVERADLLYLNSIPGRDGQEFQVMQMYYKYIQSYQEILQPDGSVQVSTEDIDQNNLKTYKNSSDIEWSICMKLIKKLSTYVNFPMLVNSNLWTQNKCEDRNIQIYKDNNNAWRSEGHVASLSNASKVCLIASQFNLLARKKELPEGLSEEEKNGYINFFKNITDIYTEEGLYTGERTFMEDIYPYIKKIKIKNSTGSQEYTGYYDRIANMAADADKPQNDEKDNYLWGNYTFYPTGYNKGASNWTVDLKKKYGYLETFTFTRGGAPDTTEKYSSSESNQEMFYGTDADRSSSGKHYQNVVGQPQNQSIFTTGGNRFLQVFSSLREILLKPKPNAVADKMIIKVKKPAFKYNSGYGWFLNLYDNDNENNAISENEVVTVTFTVENPADNKNDGYFYVQEVNVKENEDAKTPQHYEEKLNSSKAYIQEDDCIDVEIKTKSAVVVSGSPWQVVNPKKVTDTKRDMTGYKVPAGEKLTFQFKYRLTDYLGRTTGLDGKRYPLVIFSSRVVGYDYEPITDVSVPKGGKAYLVKNEKALSTGYTVNYNEKSKKALLYEGSDAAVWVFKSKEPTSGACIDEDVNKNPAILDIENLNKIKTGDYITINTSWELLEVTEKTDPVTDYVSLDFMKRHLFNLQ